jgi:hypothetical protein
MYLAKNHYIVVYDLADPVDIQPVLLTLGNYFTYSAIHYDPDRKTLGNLTRNLWSLPIFPSITKDVISRGAVFTREKIDFWVRANERPNLSADPRTKPQSHPPCTSQQGRKCYFLEKVACGESYRRPAKNEQIRKKEKCPHIWVMVSKSFPHICMNIKSVYGVPLISHMSQVSRRCDHIARYVYDIRTNLVNTKYYVENHDRGKRETMNLLLCMNSVKLSFLGKKIH